MLAETKTLYELHFASLVILETTSIIITTSFLKYSLSQSLAPNFYLGSTPALPDLCAPASRTSAACWAFRSNHLQSLCQPNSSCEARTSPFLPPPLRAQWSPPQLHRSPRRRSRQCRRSSVARVRYPCAGVIMTTSAIFEAA